MNILLEVGVPVVKKKRVVGRRVLSIALSLLMILCAIPFVSFAAIDPVVPDNDARFTVLERSSETVYIQKAIPDVSEQEVIYPGSKLGDYVFKKTGANLRVAVPDGSGGYSYDNYKVTKLSVEFVNKDSIAQPGMNKEPVIIYVTANPDIWVQIEYVFEVQGTPQAEIIEKPVIDSPVSFKENMRVSDLKFTGGQANVEGTFGYTNPDQIISSIGDQQIEMTFTPQDAAAAEAVTFTVPVTIEKGEIVINTAPTVTLTVGQTLYANGGNFEGAVTEPANAKFQWCGLNGETLGYTTKSYAKGEYTLDARVSAGSNYVSKMTPVKVIYLPVTTPLQINVSDKDGVVALRTNVTNQPGTLTWYADGVEIASGVKGTDTFEWKPAASKTYTLTVEYVPAENDSYAYTPGSIQLTVLLPQALTVTGGSGSGSYKPGETVRVELDQDTIKKNYEFKGWKITDAEGKTLDVGVEDLSQTSISFVMPDQAVNVEATQSFSIQLFFSNLGQSILNFFMKIYEWFSGLFNGMGSLT